MPRVHVIGSAGAGKTMLGARLAAALNITHIELDSLYWGEHWQPAELEDFQRAVRQATAADDWVVDGNYSKVRQIVWQRVQLVVWLDYPLLLVLVRLFRRTLERVFSRELLWGRNRESLAEQFFSRESLFLYVLRTHRTRRVRYAQLCRLPEFGGIEFVRLRSPAQTRRWFQDFTSQRGSPAG
jgi:adenylate kinase family enzyme